MNRLGPLPLIFAVLSSIISIQIGASYAKQLFPLIGAQGTSALRLGIAAVILCLVWRPWKVRLTGGEWLKIMYYGLSLGGMNFLFYQAIERIPLGIAVALEFTGPLLLAVTHSKKWADGLWALLAMGGVILILPTTSGDVPLNLMGVLFAVGAGACWALYIVSGQTVGSAIHSGVATSLGMLTAALLVAPIGVIYANESLLSWKVLPLAVLVAILSSAFPYSMEMFALKRLPAKTFSILMSIEPAIGALSGLVFLHEKLTLIQWIAILCIVMASLGTSLTSQSTRTSS